MSGRRTLLGVVTGLAAVPQIASAKGVSTDDTPSSDAELVTLAAELRSIEAAYNAGCSQSDEFCNSRQGKARLVPEAVGGAA